MENPEEILLDVNKLAEGKKFTTIGAFAISPDHKLMAYSADFTGGEKYTIALFDLANKKFLADQIQNTIGDVTRATLYRAVIIQPVITLFSC